MRPTTGTTTMAATAGSWRRARAARRVLTAVRKAVPGTPLGGVAGTGREPARNAFFTRRSQTSRVPSTPVIVVAFDAGEALFQALPKTILIAAGIGAFSPRRLPQPCAAPWYGRGELMSAPRQGEVTAS